jgi:DNA-binding SARP family transcriptional activator
MNGGVMADGLEFCLLGPLIVRSGGTVVPVRQAKQRVLLAALLLDANRVVRVDALAEALWEAATPPSARNTVRNYVKRLRDALGEAGRARISSQPRGYSMQVSPGEFDVRRFEVLLEAARGAARHDSWAWAADQAGAALQLWQGEALADIDSDLLRQREVSRLAEMRLHAEEIRFDAAVHLGRQAEVIGELRRHVTAHPLRERFHALLMLALYCDGRQAEALAAYQQAYRVLADELAAEPGIELRELHHRILTGEPALTAPGPASAMAQTLSGNPVARPLPEPATDRVSPAPGQLARAGADAVPRQLPAAVGCFTGRDAELAALTGLLDAQPGARPPAMVISAIGGTAGVGKTALAVHWAHLVAQRFPDGQLYVNLRGYDPTDSPAAPAGAIRGFLDALGVAPERIPASLDAQAGLFRSLLADKKMLIVLDNAHDEQQVRPLLPAGHGCLVVVTSRRQLAGLAAADGARLLTLDLPSHAEARQMLTLRVGADRAAAEPDAVDQIASLCARLPLALAVAAARAHACPWLSLAALAAELSDMADRLEALDAGDPAASVRAVFSWSYQQLSPEAARMFRLLGLHPGPDITVPAAASLTATLLPAARQALRELTAANLLTEHSSGRYGFHDLLRAYAADQAATADDEETRQAATGRMLDHYLHTGYAAALLLKPSREPLILTPPRSGVTPEHLRDHQRALDWFEAEHKALLAAVGLAAETGFDTCAWQLPSAMSDFLDRRGHWHESAAILRTALAAATRVADTGARAMVARALGTACAWLADYDQARAHMTDSLGLYRKLGEHRGQARVHQSLAWVAGRSGRYGDALGHAEQALTLFQATADRAGQARALNAVGFCHAMLGDAQRARSFCQRALALNQELGLRRDEAHAWDSLGYTEHQLGHQNDAADCYQNALCLFRELGDRFNEAEILTHLGDARRAGDDQQAALDAWQQALVILDDLRHPDADKVRAKLGR